MNKIPEDFLLSSYRFDLPRERIAQEPARVRDGSRLLVLDRAAKESSGCREALFTDLPDILTQMLPQGALLVANNSRVLPARLFGRRPTGGKVECLLLTPLPIMEPVVTGGHATAQVQGLLRASKPMKPGQSVELAPGFGLEVLSVGEFGQCRMLLHWPVGNRPKDALNALAGLCVELGHLPLPPYIRRPDTAADRDRYQTTYADATRTGSVAAPTAGLHFTPAVRRALAARGFQWAEVTLYVGYGTFSPVRCEDIRDHEMHREYVEIDAAAAAAVNAAKAEGRPVIAVGTTSVRALEGAALAAVTREIESPDAGSIFDPASNPLAPFRGWTDIFLYPGQQFRVIDHMLTNFHLPESSLVMMLAAFAGRTRVLDAYAQAISSEFRFFSYGDCMLVL